MQVQGAAGAALQRASQHTPPSGAGLTFSYEVYGSVTVSEQLVWNVLLLGLSLLITYLAPDAVVALLEVLRLWARY